jgi:quinone-modifying oxidoreductase subunit QmoC
VAIRANPRLIEELELYGAEDVSKCYHCGNCSATCPFSREPFLFPRKSMRYLQMGLEEKLKGNLDAWLCYYCGECSDECPREAEPGETMMSLRRWLTSQYDFTGISKLFYRSWKAELAAILLVAVLTGLGFYFYGSTVGRLEVYDGPGAFLPSSAIHKFDWALGFLLAGLLLINCGRMWWFSMGRDPNLRIPLSAYVRKLILLPFHFFTQSRYRQCEKKRPWVIHLVLMLSYTTMLVLIMFFLHFMQSGPEIDWRVHAFGYLATAGLLVTTAFALIGRIRKNEAHYKHSHESDWIFLIMLVYVVGTGFLQHILHRAGLNTGANLTYLAHMMGVVPMLGLEVPFSKWAHLAYRPLGMYFSALQEDALMAREPIPAAAAPLRAA